MTVAREIDCECRSAPRERDSTTAVPVIVNEQFVPKPLRVNHETAGPVRSQPDDFANDSIASNFDGRKVASRLKSE